MHYIDTSAVAKLVVQDVETAALRSRIAAESRTLVSSDLVRTELLRAARRAAPDRAVQARALLDAITLLTVPTATFEAAAQLDPTTTLWTLDAIHLAVALELGDDLAGLITYDDRLAAAAQAHGIAVVAPA